MNRKKVLALWRKTLERELDIRYPGKYAIEYRNSDEMPYTQKNVNEVFRLINNNWSRWLKTAELAALWNEQIGFAAIFDEDGVAIQTPSYCHHFTDGVDAAACIEKFLNDGRTWNWPDNEPHKRTTIEKHGEWLLSSEIHQLLSGDDIKMYTCRHLGENFQRLMAYFGITVE